MMRRTGAAPRVRRTGRAVVVSVLSAGLLALTGCAGAPGGSSGRVELDYWLWEALQLPAYQGCVDAFEQKNPGIGVRITQYGWDDYWQKLTAGLVAGAGPDVFTDHLTKYPEFVQRDAILPLDDITPTADLDADAYQPGLADLWKGTDGHQYGSPKDFDTIALFYDAKVLKEAGLTPDDLNGLDWNPDDGGTFEDVIARLSLDTKGVRGDEEGFDPKSVKRYGLASGGSGGTGHGQTQWAWLAASTGWKYTNANVWGSKYNYNDKRVQDSLAWLFGLVDKGFLPSFEKVGTTTPSAQLGAGSAGLAPDGSWTIQTYNRLDGVDLGVAPVPAGPIGHPVSMYNGLGDSISAQTPYPEQSARLVKFLGTKECQDIVGKEGVVFPARPESTEVAIKAFAKAGVDVTPFTDLVDDGDTVFFPVTTNGADVLAIMQPVLDSIYIGKSKPSVLTKTNERINTLLKAGG